MKFKGDDVRILIEARRLAKAHGLYIIEKHDCLLLYRKLPNTARGLFIGRRTTTAAMLDLVKHAAATTTADASRVLHATEIHAP